MQKELIFIRNFTYCYDSIQYVNIIIIDKNILSILFVFKIFSLMSSCKTSKYGYIFVYFFIFFGFILEYNKLIISQNDQN